MDRTIVLQLHPTSEQAQALQRTLEQYTACYNAVAQEGFTTECSNGVELHKRTYYPLRAQYPDLPAQLVCAARVKATESVKSVLTWRKKYDKNYLKRVAKAQKRNKPIPIYKPVKTPQSPLCAIRYDARSYWVKWNTRTCSLATLAGRVEIRCTIPKHSLLSLTGKPCSADLCYRKGRYRLHVVVSIPAPTVEKNDGVVGIDLGLTRPAVTSTRHFLGDRHWKEQERRLFRLRRKLQKCGSQSAKRHLKKLSGQLFRQRKDHDHVLSKGIVQHAPPGSTIVLENLTDIRERVTHKKKDGGQRRMHSWSFAQLFRFLAYKAEARGIQVARIDPRHTSQTCSRCGHQARHNRRSQSLFFCRSCGYCLNADLNASYNIREKYLASLAQDGTSILSGSPCQAAYWLDSSESGTSPRL
jgi:putative transposase